MNSLFDIGILIIGSIVFVKVFIDIIKSYNTRRKTIKDNKSYFKMPRKANENKN